MNKINIYVKIIRQFLFKHKVWVFFSLLLGIHIFLRFYQLEHSIFNYDQVDSAWAAKRILIDRQFTLIGPANKLGSGIFVGPLYYYAISIFYYFTNLDPSASALFAGFTSIFSFCVLFIITKKLFSTRIAFIALFINTFAFSAIEFDRVQWEINFIAPLAYIAYYFLYRVLKGEEKFIFWLAITLGFAYHIHLTISVFLSIIVVLCLPFFPRSKSTLKYILYSVPILLIALSPIIIVNLMNKNTYASGSLTYAQNTFHGLHLTRLLQLKNAAFIQIESFITFSLLKGLAPFTIPLFLVFYLINTPTQKKFIISTLTLLWFTIPWIVLSTYSQEITDYYFSTNRFVGLTLLSYLISLLSERKNKLITIMLIIFGLYFIFINMQKFFVRKRGLYNYRNIAKQYIKEGKIIPFKEGDPLSFLYFYYHYRAHH